MACAGARAYNGDLRAEHPAGSRSRAPGQEVRAQRRRIHEADGFATHSAASDGQRATVSAWRCLASTSDRQRID